MKLVVPTKRVMNWFAWVLVDVAGAARSAGCVPPPSPRSGGIGRAPRFDTCVTYTVVIFSSRCRRFNSNRIFSRSFASRLKATVRRGGAAPAPLPAHGQAPGAVAGRRRAVASAFGEVVELHGREDTHHVVADFLARITAAADLKGKRGVLEHVHVRPDRVGLKAPCRSRAGSGSRRRPWTRNRQRGR